MNIQKHTQSLDIQSNADQQDNVNYSNEIVEREPIENTPFTIVTIEGQSFGTMGNYRITEPFDTKEEAIKETVEINWNRIVQIIAIINEKLK